MTKTLDRIHATAPNLWLMRFQHKLFGTAIGRTVTLIRLDSSEVVLHSTAPFTAQDVSAIRQLGWPVALVEATMFHDTFIRSARASFPDVPLFVPEGLRQKLEFRAESLSTPPETWAPGLQVLRLEGMPNVQEHVFFHMPSRTLIVADLVFNFGPHAGAWTRFFFRRIAGVKRFPGMSRLFRFMIRDREAFKNSVREMMQWDFHRVIVGHGDVIESQGKSKLRNALARHGFC
jgi:hypothetical protein